MSAQLKQFKEIEDRVHEQLYLNVFLLTHTYPASKEFNAIFKRDMFVKSNKAAFHQVVYYLLHTLNPELTQERITTWPPYDAKLETKFRNEVVACINELNTTYKDANIPNIMASQLVTPGGFKFAKFMLKLSQLVLLEDLKKTQPELVLPIKPHKNPAVTNIIMKNLKKKTEDIEAETRQLNEKFKRGYENASTEASSIVFDQTQLNNDFKQLNEIVERKEDTFESQSYSSIKEALTVKLNELKNKTADMEKIRDLCIRGDELLTRLSSDNFYLQYNQNEVLVPRAAAQAASTSNEKLDLYKLFTDLNAALQDQNFNMPVFTENQLNDMIKTTEKINEEYSRLNMRLAAYGNKLVEISNNCNDAQPQKNSCHNYQ